MKTIRSEAEYLIHLLYCAVHQTVPRDIPDGFSWESVLDCAVKHEVAPFAFTAVQRLANKPDPQILSRWQEKYYQSVTRNATQMRARNQIISALHERKIYTIEVQGTVVKRYYPAAHLRLMSDIDIVVLPEQTVEACEALRRLGYAVEELYDNEANAEKGQVFVELHSTFFGAGKADFADIQMPFSYAEKHDDYSAAVPDTIFYLYNMLHCLKHYHYQGMGISRVLDIYYLKQALWDSVDRAYIDDLLARYGLSDEMNDLYALAEEWFGDTQSGRDLSAVAAEIIEAERHGTAQIKLRRELRRTKEKSGRFVRMRTFLQRIFPSKRYMYIGYPFCFKHNLPLVLCWIYRVFAILFSAEKLKRFAVYLRQLTKVR